MTGTAAGLTGAIRRAYAALVSRLLGKGAYWRNVATVTVGTVGAQAIGIASMLAVARLYTPAEFGAFAFFFAVAGLLTLLGTGRYELAVFVARREREAFDTALLSLSITALVALVLLAAAPLLAPVLQAFGATHEFSRFSLLLPATVAVGGAAATLMALATQQRAYKAAARGRLLQALTAAAVNITLGLFGWGATGLILGFIAGQTVAVALLAIHLRLPRALRSLRPRALAVRARRNANFPRFILLGDTFNYLGGNMVALVTPNYFGPAALGQYNLGQRVAGLPLTIIGGAMGEVFRSGISPQHTRSEDVRGLFRFTAMRLAAIGAVLTAPLLLAAPLLFSLAFGAKWREAGVYVQILSPVIFARFVVSPLSAVLHLRGRQKLDAALQVTFVVTALLAFFIGLGLKSFLAMVLALAVFHTTLYMVYFFASWWAVKSG
ncbi:MAG TPA: oligosaccharide flippase family protein [Caulobacteraceae bacterium]